MLTIAELNAEKLSIQGSIVSLQIRSTNLESQRQAFLGKGKVTVWDSTGKMGPIWDWYDWTGKIGLSPWDANAWRDAWTTSFNKTGQKKLTLSINMSAEASFAWMRILTAARVVVSGRASPHATYDPGTGAVQRRLETSVDISALPDGLHTIKIQWICYRTLAPRGGGFVSDPQVYYDAPDMVTSFNAEIAELQTQISSLNDQLNSIEEQLAEALIQQSLSEQFAVIREEIDAKVITIQEEAAIIIQEIQEDYAIRDENVRIEADAKIEAARIEAENMVSTVRVETDLTIKSMEEDYIIRDENVRLEADAKIEAARIEAETRIEAARIEADTKITLAREEADAKIEAIRLEKADQFASMVNQINTALGVRDGVEISVETIFPATTEEILKITQDTSLRIQSAINEADALVLKASEEADIKVANAISGADMNIEEYRKATEAEIIRIQNEADAKIKAITEEVDIKMRVLEEEMKKEAGIITPIDWKQLLSLAMVGGVIVAKRGEIEEVLRKK